MASLVQYLGLARSLALYYADPDQVHRAARFYRRFIRAGDLCFDVGAHVGSRVAAWTRLGARTVAIEPFPHCARLLRLLYGRRDVEVVEAALGPVEGRTEILVYDREPTVSTISAAWASRICFSSSSRSGSSGNRGDSSSSRSGSRSSSRRTSGGRSGSAST